MITSFRHKGLKQMFEKGQARLIEPSIRSRVANVLAILDAAASPLGLASTASAATGASPFSSLTGTLI
jgi:plasmid maintenance system killer protein